MKIIRKTGDPKDLSIFDDDIKEIQKQWAKNKPSANRSDWYQDFIEDRIAVMKELRASDPNEKSFSIKENKLFSEIRLFQRLYFNDNFNLDDLFIYVDNNEKLKYFLRYQDEFSDKEYWSKLSDIYTGIKYQKIPQRLFSAIFKSERPAREFMMDKDEQDYYDNLPESFTAFRCMSKKELESQKFGFSWTLSKEVASFFQERNNLIYDEEHIIHEMTLNKSETIAYLNGREEEEILYHPNR